MNRDGSDDDETPREKPPRRVQASTERDLGGFRARKERDDRTAAVQDSARAQLARDRDQHERPTVPMHPVPDRVEHELSGTVEVPIDPVTERSKPWEVLDRPLHPAEQQIVHNSKRELRDPLDVGDGAKIYAKLDQLLDMREDQHKRANVLLAALDTTPSGKLAGRVRQLEKRSRTWDWVLRGLLVLCAGGVWKFLDSFWERSAHEAEMKFKLDSEIKTTERLDAETKEAIKRQDALIDRLERRINMLATPQHSTKDPQP